MTEQMTGRQGPAGTERPAPQAPGAAPLPAGPPGAAGPSPSAAAAGPSAPSPRDLAARSPHHPAARDGQPRSAEAPVPAPPQAGVPAQGSAPESARVQVTSPGKVQATGAQALVYALERVGADVVFGIPGGAVLPAYDPLLDSKAIRHILVRHEQGPATRPPGTRRRPGGSACAWRPAARAPRTW